MRLIGSLHTPEAVVSLARMLEEHKIAHTIEPHTVTDWGSHTYGDRSWAVWITNEEDVQTAQKLYEEFLKQHDPLAPHPHPSSSPLSPSFSEIFIPGQIKQEASLIMPQPPLKIVTILMILTCIVCFIASYSLTPSPNRGEFFSTPLIPTDPIKKNLLYDFPPYYVFANNFLKSLQNKPEENLTDEQIQAYQTQLMRRYHTRPVWQGYYTIALAWFKGEPWQEDFHAPRFEKIQQGEVWRIFTPIFLHQNLLHILFNLLWIFLLGRQLEAALGSFRYLGFCLVVVAVSNTAQYLMSGPNFLGISGLVCGMITFIWVRTKQTKRMVGPREYFLNPGTFQGLAIFVLALCGVQILSFSLEATTGYSIPIGIANTAHIVGGLCGALLAISTSPKRITS